MKEDAILALCQFKNNIDKRFPKYIKSTNEIHKIFTLMIEEDYSCVASDAKKFRIVKQYMRAAFEKAFNEVGTKNYLKLFCNMLNEKAVCDYICHEVGNYKTDFLRMAAKLKAEIEYWQGRENVEYIKLEQILICLE